MIDENRVKAVDAFLKANGVVPRSAWGAREAKIPDKAESLDWNYDTVVIHHSGRSGDENPSSIQSKHMGKNGWDDVGYHLMVGPAGQVYEGRRLYYKGSHTEGANTGKVGILVMGDHESEFLGLLGRPPTAVQMLATTQITRGLKTLFPTLRVLGGHKDFKVKTECPGNLLYDLLDGLRAQTGLVAPRI